MLRNPITLVASLIMLVSVAVLNYVHFTGSGEDVADEAATGGDGEPGTGDELGFLIEKLAEFRKPGAAAQDRTAEIAGLTKNPFLHPEERRTGKSLHELEQEMAASTPVVIPDETPTPMAPEQKVGLAQVEKMLAPVELTAVIWSEASAVAVLGGEILREGDEIFSGRAKVRSITPRAVEIQVGGRVITKRLKPFESVLPPEPPAARTPEPTGAEALLPGGTAPGGRAESDSSSPSDGTGGGGGP